MNPSISEINRKKLVLLCTDQHNERRWIHFCYVPSDVYDSYFMKLDAGKMETIRKRLRLWAKQDFGVDVKLNTLDDLRSFRKFILNMYKSEYSELFPKGGFTFSTQGWVTLWVTRHMEMEIETNENPSS